MLGQQTETTVDLNYAQIWEAWRPTAEFMWVSEEDNAMEVMKDFIACITGEC